MGPTRTIAAAATGVAFLLVCALLVAGRVRAEGEGEVEIRTKDGRVIAGTIVSEGPDAVIVETRFGQVPIPRADIAEIKGGAAAPEPGTEGSEAEEEVEAETETITILHLKDGSVVRGRLRDRGAYVEIASDRGSVLIDKRSIKEKKEEVVRRPKATPSPAEAPQLKDYGLGFVVGRPSADWRFDEPSPDPLARMQMRRRDPLAVFQVRLAPALEPLYREVEPRNLDRLKAVAGKELEERYRSVKALRVSIDRYQGAPVWRLRYEAETRVFGSRHAYREVRFHRGDAHFVLVAYCPVDLERAAEADLEAALASFSFMGPVEATDDGYVSFAAGYRLARPAPDWRVVARVLEPAAPVEVLAPFGDARYGVNVGAAAPFRNAAEAVDALERTLEAKSRFYKRLGREDRMAGGQPAVELRYHDFGEGGVRLREFRRLLVLRGDRLVELAGSRAATDVLGPENERAVDALFATFEAFEPDSPAQSYARGRRALERRIAGEKRLDERSPAAAIPELTSAIDLYPTYGLAFLLRGKAYADTGNFKAALRDYDVADDLLDDAAVARLVGQAQAQQAATLRGEGDHEGAVKAYQSAIRNEPENKKYREDLVRTVLDWSKTLTREGKYDDAVRRLKESQRDLPGETRIDKEIVRVYQEQATKLRQDDDLIRARNAIRKALKLEPENSRSQQILRQIEESIKKKEEGKKSGKK